VLDKMVGGSSTATVSVVEASEWAAEQTAPDPGSATEAGLVDGWVLAVEENGCQATLPEAVQRISKGSRAIVVSCDVYGDTSFVYAVDGVVVRSFDPLLYDHPTPWDGPPLPEESGLDFGNHPMASAFACAERLTGVRLTPDLVDEHGDWLATGHHPSHSPVRAALSAADTANAERQARVEDHRRQSIPNRLVGGDQLPDALQLFLPGWIGWIQFLLCVIAVTRDFGYERGLTIPDA
ncbi:MAG: DUF6461 domain-containing protein, partial [Actinobacteria bacterium]|nr:DUF6461 domain-containing protein [Actinomycetota bacterium]